MGGGQLHCLGNVLKTFCGLDHIPPLTCVCVCVCVRAGCGVLCEAEGAKVGAVCGGVPTLDGTSLSHLHTAGKPATTPLPSTGHPQPYDPPGGWGLSGEDQGMGLWAGLGIKARVKAKE